MERLILAVLLLAGSGAAEAKKYHNLNLPPEAEERQFTIDNGRCKQVAVGAAPMPAIIPQSPAPSGYAIHGTATTTGAGGMTTTYFNGNASPTVSGGFAGGFAQGMGNGMALGMVLRQQREQKEIYEGCMATLGWEEGKRPAQVASMSRMQSAAPAPLTVLPPSPKSEDEQWLADARAFLDANPDVTASKATLDSFDSVVRDVTSRVGYASLSNAQKLQLAYNIWRGKTGE